MRKNNIIIITLDGTRLDRVKNSKLFQKLKENSVFFSNCITYAPHTIAAMHAIFSGCYGTRTGTNSYWSTYKFKKQHFKTLTEYLKDSGYITSADLHSEIVIPSQGFDDFNIYDEKRDELTIRHTNLLEQMNLQSKSGNPFFLYLHNSTIHTGISEYVLKAYTNYSKVYFENKKNNEVRYDNLFHKVEQYVEKILNKINDLGLFSNSVICILSDHGISVGEKFGERAYGSFCFDYTIKVFGYLIGPNLLSKEIMQQIRTVDFMPTILEYLKIEQDNRFEPLDGISLLPLINGKQMDEIIAYSETGNPLDKKEPPKEPNTKAVRTSNWKLIHNEYNETFELYDLINDPKEEKNLVGKGLEIENMLQQKLQLLKIGKRAI